MMGYNGPNLRWPMMVDNNILRYCNHMTTHVIVQPSYDDVRWSHATSYNVARTSCNRPAIVSHCTMVYDIVWRSTTSWVITVWYIIQFNSTFCSVNNYLKMGPKGGRSKDKGKDKGGGSRHLLWGKSQKNKTWCSRESERPRRQPGRLWPEWNAQWCWWRDNSRWLNQKNEDQD